MITDYMILSQISRETDNAVNNLNKGLHLQDIGDYVQAKSCFSSAKSTYEWIYKVAKSFKDEGIMKNTQQNIDHCQQLLVDLEAESEANK